MRDREISDLHVYKVLVHFQFQQKRIHCLLVFDNVLGTCIDSSWIDLQKSRMANLLSKLPQLWSYIPTIFNTSPIASHLKQATEDQGDFCQKWPFHWQLLSNIFEEHSQNLESAEIMLNFFTRLKTSMTQSRNSWQKCISFVGYLAWNFSM